MASPKPLLKSGHFLPGVSPPPYDESEMWGSNSGQQPPNQHPGYGRQVPKTFSPPSAPQDLYSGPNVPNNGAGRNISVPVNGPPTASTTTAVNFVMPGPQAVNPGPAVTNMTAVNMPAGVIPVGPHTMQMRCHHCQAFISTKINTTAHSSAHFACCLLFFFSCGLFSCIPYCLSSCRRVDHFCPNCSSYLGSYNP
ncbi:lipopolysaccharide-induced tumor necrosis factor-alpha factor homolog [Ischnura elegans]|uniref:lipopolysaccharide-induced tumor necrosis factor-alpha factor homolog n=1 Tax=Ischnura elegans TaxID=197161 RepID=UPI001ED88255|nr:lipopolysaccharide-induced tumor necrosis factor-alpha factor homolog [Ischnura elegans]